MPDRAEQEQGPKRLHRVVLEFEPNSPPRLKLIHPKGACERATACGECGKRIGDPAVPDCEFCPDEVEDCWLTGWVEQFTADEVLSGPVEFPVIPECDGEEFTLLVAAEQPPNVLSRRQAQMLVGGHALHPEHLKALKAWAEGEES
jgi:hypothetical protein